MRGRVLITMLGLEELGDWTDPVLNWRLMEMKMKMKRIRVLVGLCSGDLTTRRAEG
jgi:hypothetical protein